MQAWSPCARKLAGQRGLEVVVLGMVEPIELLLQGEHEAWGMKGPQTHGQRSKTCSLRKYPTEGLVISRRQPWL